MFQELTAEQELFCNIVKTLSKAPFAVHAQCQTTQESNDSNIHLPTARFDIMVNSLPTDSTAEAASTLVAASTSETCKVKSGVVVLVNGRSKENAEMLVSNKTNKTFNLRALSMFRCVLSLMCTYLFCPADVTIVLESLIFVHWPAGEAT